jgi:hypothetical protein
MGFKDFSSLTVGQPASWLTGPHAKPAPGLAERGSLAGFSGAEAGSVKFNQAFQAWSAEAREAKPAPELAQGPGPSSLPLSVRTVAAGDTLTGMVKDQAQAQGVQLSGSQAQRLAQLVASDNKLANANRIFPGQQLSMSSIEFELQALKGPSSHSPVLAKATPAATALQNFPVITSQTGSVAKTGSVAITRPAPETRHDVLDKTLARAVAKGFIPANEKTDVRDKILDLAKTHRFNPDDFARMTLMESDGMNPRASNQRCHGIIQFCDGSDRGAASAGYAANPKAILGLSVYQQLHLVDKYFDDVGLKNKGPAGLDDLYLSVLMPSARSETRSDAPLAINGTQARYLYEGRDSSASMTRQSIAQGLLQNAAERLGLPTANSATQSGRLQALRTAAYDDNSQAGPRHRTQLR